MSKYRTLFDARGARYNLANRLFPEARAEEAERLLAHLEIGAGERWLDVGAGGGFLGHHAAACVPESVAVGCDESVAFLSEAADYAFRAIVEYGRLPFPDGVFAAAGCLAVLHHAEDPMPVIEEMLRVTASGGRVVVGDVASGSRPSRFLNEFVDRHTDTGHSGRFYEPRALAGFFEAAGGRDVRAAAEEIRWTFESRAHAHQFCRELFGLRPETDRLDLDGALNYLGIGESAGRWSLPWQMLFVSAAVA